MLPAYPKANDLWQTLSVLSIRGPKGNTLLAEVDEDKILEFFADFENLVADVMQKHGGYLYEVSDSHALIIFGLRNATDKHAQAAYNAAMDFLPKALAQIGSFPVCVALDTGDCLITEAAETGIRVTGEPIFFSAIISEEQNYSFSITDACAYLLGADKAVSYAIDKITFRNKTRVIYYLDFLRAGSLASPLSQIGFAGRSSELAILSSELAEMRLSSASPSLLITGEAGIGKSRLVTEFLNLQKKALQINYSFFPGIQPRLFLSSLLKDALKFIGLEDYHPSKNLADYLIAYFCFDDPDLAQALEELLFDTAETSESQNKAQSLVVANVIKKISLSAPLILILEDIQWSSYALEIFLQEYFRIESGKTFLVMTSRKNMPWKFAQAPRTIHLLRLDLKDIQTIVLQTFSADEDQRSIADMLYVHSEGHPLYLFEMIRYLTAQHFLDRSNQGLKLTKPISEISVPYGLQNLIQTQVACISRDAREILNFFAILGHRVSKDLFNSIFNWDNDDLTKTLIELSEANLLCPLENGLEEIYVFRHALIQMAVYNAIRKQKRLELHQYVFSKLKILANTCSKIPLGDLAYHAHAGELTVQAYHYNYRHAMDSFKKYEPRTSIQALKKCVVHATKFMPSFKIFRHLKLRFLMARNAFLLADFSKMGTLIDEIEEIINESSVPLSFLSAFLEIKISYFWVTAKYRRALIDAERLMKLKKTGHDPAISGLLRISGIYSDTGDFELSNHHSEKAIKLLNPHHYEETHNLAFPSLGFVYATRARCYAWQNNIPDTRQSVCKALEIADLQQEPSSRIYIFCFTGEALLRIGAYDEAWTILSKAKSLSEIYRVDILKSFIDVLHAYLSVCHFDEQDGIRRMQLAIKKAESEKRMCRLSLHYLYLGLGLRKRDEIAPAKRALIKSFLLARRYEESAIEAEALRHLLAMLETNQGTVSQFKLNSLKLQAVALEQEHSSLRQSSIQIRA